MRFEPIETLPKACPLFIEDAYESLVSKFGVTAWHWLIPIMVSELERFLVNGKSRRNRNDFHELNTSYGRYSYLDVFDHAICFKSNCGPFVLTMPYGDNITFHKAFDEFVADYYKDKERVISGYERFYPRAYRAEAWESQLSWKYKFDAVIVPNWFKVRENGDFAAIVAMDYWLRNISEQGGFQLVNADGSER